jgi:hypothetical protein
MITTKTIYRLRYMIALASCLGAQASFASLIAHYSFDSDLTDSSGNGNHGTLTDVGATGNSAIISTPGSFAFGGGSMDFSDERDYVAIPSHTFGSGTPYTIAFWAQRDSAARTWDMVLGQRDNTNFFIAPNAGGFTRWRSSSSAVNRQNDFASPADTAWHHYAFVADGTDLHFYFDGGFLETASGKQTGFIVDTIGDAYTNTGLDFRGRIDEVWILDEVSDATTIDNLYTLNSLIPEPSSMTLLGLGSMVLCLLRRK